MFDMIKKLQQAQQEMQKIKERLGSVSVEGKSVSGNVKVTADGNRVIKGITIADEALNQDRDNLQNEIVSAVNNAIEQADKVNEAEMKSAASGMMPGLGGMFK